MRFPRDVALTLADWKYFPPECDDFSQNWLANRVKQYNVDEPRCFASVCAVPRGRSLDRTSSVEDLTRWLDPNQRQYEPRGVWLPYRQRTLTSQGLLLIDDHTDRWESYLHLGFDGYVEFGRIAGSAHKGVTFFRYGPIIRWIQRLSAFCQDVQTILDPAPVYWIVLNIAGTRGGRLGVLGEGWREPWEWDSDELECALEDNVQIHRSLNRDDDPVSTGRWFAERLGAAFGMNQPRCYNRVGDRVGELSHYDF